jgi:DNA-binding XRE family transcriptional regulator
MTAVRKFHAGSARTAKIGVGASVVKLSRARYEALIRHIEDLEDALTIRRAEARGRSKDALAAELVHRLIDGEHPLRVWRDHRGLTLSALAKRARVPVGYLSEIETKKKPGSLATMRKLARALDLDLDDIVP